MSILAFDHAHSLSALFCLALAVQAPAGATITATARVKGAGGVEASAPVTITIDRFSSDAERTAILDALKRGGTGGVRTLLATRDRIGSVQIGSSVTPVKYAYGTPTADGRLITVVTGSPIAFIGASAPRASDKTGFDLGLVVLEVATSGSGKGEIVPAAKVRIGEKGEIVTEDYSSEVVQLVNVTRK
jgi:hypothetical protein